MPATLSYPGVYIEELPSGVNTITGVATSIAAFVGWAPQGPIDQATMVESWPDFETQFGGFSQSNGNPNYLGYAVNQFFTNGGQQAYIVRLVADGNDGTIAAGTASVNLTDSNNNTFLTLLAANPGNWATDYGILVSPRAGSPGRFSLSVVYAPGGVVSQVVESYQNLSLSSADPLYVVTIINSDSSYVTFAPNYAPPSTSLPSSIPSTPFMLTGQLPIYLQDNSTPPKTFLQIQPTPPSKWPANLAVSVTAPTNSTLGDFNLAVVYHPATGVGGITPPVTVESYSNLSLTKTNVNYVVKVLNSISNFLEVPSTYSPPAAKPAFPSTPAAVQLINVGSVSVVDGAGNALLTVQASSPSEWPENFGILAQADASPTGGPTRTGFDLELVYAPASGAVGNVTLPLPLEKLMGTSSNLAKSQFITMPPGYTPPTDPAPVWNLPATFVSTPTPLAAGALTLTDSSSPANPLMAIQPTTTAQWPAKFAVTVKAPSIPAPGNFDLEIIYNPASAVGGVSIPVVMESYTNLSVNPADAANPNSAVTVLANSSFVAPEPAASEPVMPTPPTLNLPTVFNILTVQLTNSGSFTLQDQTATPVPFLTLTPKALSVTAFGVLLQGDGTGFDMEVVYNPPSASVEGVAVPVVLEIFEGLSLSSQNLSSSQFIELAATQPTPASPPPTLTFPVSFLTSPVMLTPLVEDLDGTVLQPNTAAFENKMLDAHGDGTHGGYLLSQVPIFNLLCVPGETSALASSAAILADLQEYCFTQRAFLIVDSDINDTYATLHKSGPNSAIIGTYASNAALYFPWVQAPDPLVGNRLNYFPPCGFVAGNYAYTDASRGVWKAPAGIDASLTGASGIQYTLTDQQNGDLNIQAINCLRQFRVYGNVVWGARTLQGNDQAASQWKYVPIRRLALYLESSLYEGTQWVVFEPNDAPLWSQIRLDVGAFMQGLFLQGAFQGTTPQQAYFVKCDSENNPQSSIDQGIVNILVGFAPLYPAEFVVIQIQQMAGQLQS